MPNFEPIIGSNFDNLAGQRQFWAGFNNRVDESNLARQTQAQQEQNRWLLTLAQMQRQDQAHQDSLDEQFQRESDNQADKMWSRAYQGTKDAEERRRFDTSTQLSREQMDNTQKHWAFDAKKISDQIDRDNSTAENYAKSNANEVDSIGRSIETALSDYNTKQRALAEAAAKAQGQLPASKATYIPKSGLFVAKLSDPETLKAVETANASLGDLRQEVAEAAARHSDAAKQLQSMEQEARSVGVGFVRIPGSTGYKIIHYPTGKTWVGDEFMHMPADFNPLSRPSDAEAYETGGGNPAPVSAPTPPDDSGWAGFSPGVSNAPAVIPPSNTITDMPPAGPITNFAPSPIRVGRFVVTPR